MEKFWAVILIFVVVAAAGLMYVNEVYNPQRETQEAMADMANQTLSVVEAEIGDGTISREVSGSKLMNTINYYIERADDDVSVYFDGTDYSGKVEEIADKIVGTKSYEMEIEREAGKVKKITIT